MTYSEFPTARYSTHQLVLEGNHCQLFRQSALIVAILTLNNRQEEHELVHGQWTGPEKSYRGWMSHTIMSIVMNISLKQPKMYSSSPNTYQQSQC